jgi:hypothetical protein
MKLKIDESINLGSLAVSYSEYESEAALTAAANLNRTPSDAQGLTRQHQTSTPEEMTSALGSWTPACI